MKLNNIFLMFFLFQLLNCNNFEKNKDVELKQKIKVLNIGVFHFNGTTDNLDTKYDSNLNKNEIDEICEDISKFKPTIICVEELYSNTDELNKVYIKFKKNKPISSYKNNEILELGFKIAKKMNLAKIYCIDDDMGYDYKKIEKIAEKTKSYFFLREYNKTINTEGLNLKKTILELNKKNSYTFLINQNANLFTHVYSSNKKYEGADEASKFYQRNLRMYSNLNKIEVEENDRILIISGVTHAAFFDLFLSGSPKYEMVDLGEYIK